MIDFEMTYPCYSPIQPTGLPFTFAAGADQAIAVFTDKFILDRFFETMLPHAPKGSIGIKDGEWLGIWLRSIWRKPIAKGKPVTHVVFDPTFNAPKIRTYSIEEFIDHLEKAA
jgi:hypothetical protein